MDEEERTVEGLMLLSVQCASVDWRRIGATFGGDLAVMKTAHLDIVATRKSRSGHVM
jgi:hypothetical protein